MDITRFLVPTLKRPCDEIDDDDDFQEKPPAKDDKRKSVEAKRVKRFVQDEIFLPSHKDDVSHTLPSAFPSDT